MEIAKRISAIFGAVLVFLALAAPQLVGLLYFPPAGIIGGLVGLLAKKQLDHQSNNWIYFLPHIGAFIGTVIVGIVSAITFNWSNWLGGIAMTLIFALIIPLGAILLYYGLSGDIPRTFQLICNKISNDEH